MCSIIPWCLCLSSLTSCNAFALSEHLLVSQFKIQVKSLDNFILLPEKDYQGMCFPLLCHLPYYIVSQYLWVSFHQQMASISKSWASV